MWLLGLEADKKSDFWFLTSLWLDMYLYSLSLHFEDREAKISADTAVNSVVSSDETYSKTQL